MSVAQSLAAEIRFSEAAIVINSDAATSLLTDQSVVLAMNAGGVDAAIIRGVIFAPGETVTAGGIYATLAFSNGGSAQARPSGFVTPWNGMLDSFVVSELRSGSLYLTLKGLAEGQNYRLQFFFGQPGVERSFVVENGFDSSNRSPLITNAADPGRGGWSFTAEWTASGSSQLLIFRPEGNNRAILNGLVLSVGEKATSAAGGFSDPDYKPQTFETRREWLFGFDWAEPVLSNDLNVEREIAQALIFLDRTDGQHMPSKAFVTELLAMGFREHNSTFPMLGMIPALYLFGDAFSDEQIERIVSLARATPEFAGGGTENHRLMRWTNGYLLAQKFGGEWLPGTAQEGAVAAEELMRITKDLLMTEFRERFEKGGISEFLSPNYLALHLIPLMNLYDHAKDRELREAAEAVLHLHFAHLALNVQGGYILEPHARSGATQFTGRNLRSPNGSQYLSWIYWGSFHPGPARLLFPGERLQVVPPFFNDFRPPAYLQNLANGVGVLPFTTRSNPMHWPHTSPRVPRAVFRSAYRADGFGVGAGVQDFFPAGFYLQHSLFGIAWDSVHEAAFLQAGHNYFHSALGLQTMWRSPLSPFQQMAHHENTVLMLFNVPATDPWPNAGRADWLPLRQSRADDLVREAALRLPKTVEVKIEETDGEGSLIFIRDGHVFIGIRSLTLVKQQSLNEHFDVILSVPRTNGTYSQSGFIFEVSTEAEAGTFSAFQQSIRGNPYNFDWGTGERPAPSLEYVNTRGNHLRMIYNPVLEVDSDGRVPTLPQVEINGETLDWSTWPDIEGPGVRLKDGILTIQDREFRIP